MLSEDELIKKLHSQDKKDVNRAKRVKKENQRSAKKKQKIINRLKFQILDHLENILGVNSVEKLEPELTLVVKKAEAVAKENETLTKQIQQLQNENQNLKQQQNTPTTQPTSNAANDVNSTTNQDSSSDSAVYHDKYGNPETLAQHKHNEKVNELFGGDDSENLNSDHNNSDD